MLPISETKKKRPYLYEVDLMRIIFIFGVLLNHTTTTFMQQMTQESAWPHLTLMATHLTIHFTRMGFMFMTGLVLTLNYYHRDDWGNFFRKRFAGSGWPYLLWNLVLLIMVCWLNLPGYSWSNFNSTYLSSILHGDQFYMYYILVTLQLYILFPVIVKIFKKFSGHHWRILVVSFVLQLTLMFTIKYGLPHVDRSDWIWWFKAYGVNVLTYQFYFIFGAYTSLHYHEVQNFISKYIKWIVSVTGILALGTIIYYFWNSKVLNLSYTAAVSPHQPFMLIYDTMVIVTVFYIGKMYAHWRQNGIPHWFDLFVKNGAKISFGIYLDQTIGLTILSIFLGKLTLPDWAYFGLIPVGYLFVMSISYGVAWFCYRVPPFGIFIGRPQWHILPKNRKIKGVVKDDSINKVTFSTTER
jgi:hypothetical protein